MSSLTVSPVARRRPSMIEPLECRIAPANAFPTVTSIHRETPATVTTGANSVVFKVTFSDPVTGVDPGDFKVFTSVDAKANSTVSVAGSGSSYDVTVSGLKGNGEVRLDLVDDDSITETVLISLSKQPQGVGSTQVSLGGTGKYNGSFTGDAYHLLQTPPTVSAIAAVGSKTTSSKDVSWTVTFSEPVAGVDATDFTLALSGLTAPNAATVTPINPSNGYATSYTVSVSGLTGSAGTVGLNLADDKTIQDADGNPLQVTNAAVAAPVSLVPAEGSSNVTAIATGDVNGDGIADLVIGGNFSGFGQVSVFLGNGDGTFQAAKVFGTSNALNSVAIADVNGDGKPDIVAAASGLSLQSSSLHFVSVLFGNGDGTFQSRSDYGVNGSSSIAIAVADVNGDGKPDIVVTHPNFSNSPVVSVLLNSGSGTFFNQTDYAVGSQPVSVAVGDVNGDGLPDIVVANKGDDTVSVLLGTGGGGAFGAKTDYHTGTTPTSVAIADVNNDGKPDLLVADHSGSPTASVSLLLGNGDGTFQDGSVNGQPRTDFNFASQPNVVVAADYNGDGRLDFGAAGDKTNTQVNGVMTVFLGDGAGTFPFASGFPAPDANVVSALMADFNGDGRPDVATLNGSAVNGSVILNTGTGNFTGDVFTISSGPDLAVTAVTDGKTTAAPGDTLTYTITYKDLSSQSVTGVKLSAHLDENLDFVASENTGWSLDGSTLTKVIAGTVAGNSSTDTSLKLHVKATIGDGFSSVALTTTITDDGTHGADPNSENNSSSDYDALTGLTTDVAVTKIDDPALAVPGKAGTYTVHLKNTGNAEAFGQLSIPLPAGVSFSTVDNPGWTYDSNTRTIKNALSVPGGGAEQTVSYTATLGFGKFDSPLSTTATYTVSSSPSDSDSENNSRTELTPVYSGFYVTAPGVAVGGKYAPPLIQVYDRITGDKVLSFLAYEPKYRDSIRVAVADMNGDGVDDIITTTQHNGGRLRVFDGLTGLEFTSGAFGQEIDVFHGKANGAFVAAGDVNGDGHADIVVGSALGGGRVKVYSGYTPFGSPSPTVQVIEDFTPFGAKFRGGVRVAVGDVDGGGKVRNSIVPQIFPLSSKDEIVVGMGYYGGEVKVYQIGNVNKLAAGAIPVSDLSVLDDFKVGGKNYRGGVSVAVGDTNDDGYADIVVGRNSGKPSVFEIYDGKSVSLGGTTQTPLITINPFDKDPAKPKNTFGVRVAVTDVNGDGVADIIASVGVKNGSLVKIYNGILDKDGTHHLLDDPITAYPAYPDVALWVAGSADSPFPVV